MSDTDTTPARGRRTGGRAGRAAARRNACAAAQCTRLDHSCSWSSSPMQSSPNRSESATTTTRPRPCSVTASSGASGVDAPGPVRASTRAPSETCSVVAR